MWQSSKLAPLVCEFGWAICVYIWWEEWEGGLRSLTHGHYTHTEHTHTQTSSLRAPLSLSLTLCSRSESDNSLQKQMTRSRREEMIRRKSSQISPTSHGVFWIFGAPQHTQKKPRLALRRSAIESYQRQPALPLFQFERHTPSVAIYQPLSQPHVTWLSQSTFLTAIEFLLCFFCFSLDFCLDLIL